ncbi:MAG TPA: 50S ribosomal protein L10 [Clostridiales bacterium]|nr:50S ribosomal protein L10 [Clostridiales bacterium]
MPSEKVLEQKKQIVEELSEKLKNAVSGVIVDYKGINVTEDTQLRKQLREAGVDYFVAKNSLLSLAADKAGKPELKSVFKGTTSVALSTTDHVAPAKILVQFADKAKKLQIKLGFVDNSILDEAGVKALSKLPSREELVAKVLGGFNAPIAGFVHVLNANLRGLVVALNAIAEKKGKGE